MPGSIYVVISDFRTPSHCRSLTDSCTGEMKPNRSLYVPYTSLLTCLLHICEDLMFGQNSALSLIIDDELEECEVKAQLRGINQNIDEERSRESASCRTEGALRTHRSIISNGVRIDQNHTDPLKVVISRFLGHQMPVLTCCALLNCEVDLTIAASGQIWQFRVLAFLWSDAHEKVCRQQR